MNVQTMTAGGAVKEKILNKSAAVYGNDFGEDPERSGISELSKKGYQLLRERKIDEAIHCFGRILTLDEKNNYALVGIGDAARRQNKFQEAADYYQRCLDYHPGNNYALFGLADCYKALNQYQKAIDVWEQYLFHDDKNVTVLTRIADTYRKIHDFKNSKTVYLRVLQMDDKNPYAIIGLGHLHYDFKEYQEALYYWEKIMAIKGGDVDIRVLTSIGNCHRKLKTFVRGIPYFEAALMRDNYNFYALFGLADCYRGISRQQLSLECWNKILEFDPRNKVILTRAGDAYRGLGDFDKASEYYHRALNLEFDTYAVLGLAETAKIQGKYNEAIESLRRLIQQEPKNYRPYLGLADCYIRKNDRAKAIAALGEFQKQGIRNAVVSAELEKLKA
jgi:tetratricopeptide (TPR) repeat protein